MASQQSIQQQLAPLVWQILAQVPEGNVVTYGQLAAMAGMPNQSRLVGRILKNLPSDSHLPWWRVVNGQGQISNPNRTRQSKALKAEGIISRNSRISLKQYQWLP